MKTYLSSYGVVATILVVAILAGCQRRGSTTDRAQNQGNESKMAAADEHEHPPGTPADHAHPGEHTHEEDTTPIPGTLSGLWSEVETHRQEIDRLIAAGTPEPVTPRAFRIRTLVAAMESMSGQYVSTRQGPLTDAIQRVQQVTDLMHDAADAHDLEGTRNQKQRLDSVLEYIRGLYPAGVLTAP
jgi:hypothetical protein